MLVLGESDGGVRVRGLDGDKKKEYGNDEGLYDLLNE